MVNQGRDLTPEQENAFLKEQLAQLQAERDASQAELQAQRLAQVPRPLGQIFTPDFSVVPSCFELPPCLHNGKMDISPALINILPKFLGRPNESCHEHVKAFLVICNSQNEHLIGLDAFRLRAFPLSLMDRARQWLL